MKQDFDLNYEPFEFEPSGSFSDLVRKEYSLSKDENYQALLKQKELEQKLQEENSKRLACLAVIKKRIIESAKRGDRKIHIKINGGRDNIYDYWNQNKNGELSKDLDGLSVQWLHEEGECGNHGYNTYSDDYYVIEW